VYTVVENLVSLIENNATSSVTTQEVLERVTRGDYNKDVNFWPVVLNNGTFVASGRLNGSVVNGQESVGRSLKEVSLNETGLVQHDLWERMAAAADGDGHYEQMGWDNYYTGGSSKCDGGSATTNLGVGAFSCEAPALPPPHFVERIGFARWARTPGNDTLLVTSAWSKVLFASNLIDQDCDPAFDELCSFHHTRRLIGHVLSDLLIAADIAQLEAVFGRVSLQQYNEQGFYPYILTFDGTFTAHGVTAANAGRSFETLTAAFLDSASASGVVEAWSDAALSGGGWAGYEWRNSLSEAPYLKIALLGGVRRFGVGYIFGAGFAHVMQPATLGAPRCANSPASPLSHSTTPPHTRRLSAPLLPSPRGPSPPAPPPPPRQAPAAPRARPTTSTRARSRRRSRSSAMPRRRS
jgi:hypothetical protein